MDDVGTAVSRAPDDTSAAPPILTIDSDWERWYAWRPVRLYMSGRYAWLRVIYCRCLHKNGIETCDYTDTPEDFPASP